MKEKVNQKPFVRALVLAIVVIFVVSGLVFGFSQYRELSDGLAYSKELTESGKYNEAVQKLESISEIWLLEKLGIKEQEVFNEIQENRGFIKDKENYKQGTEEFDKENWDEAKDLLSEVSNDFRHYDDARIKIKESEDEIIERKIKKETTIIREEIEREGMEAEEVRREAEEKIQEEQEKLEARLKEQQEEVEKKYVIVNTDLLGISSHEVIDNISKGSEVKIIEEGTEWTHVEINNKEGWIWSDNLSDDSSDILDLPAIIKQWKPIVGLVRCEFRYADDGAVYGESFGSGIAIDTSDASISVITNKHIITDELGYSASSCHIFFPERDYLYKGQLEDLYTLSSGEDGAFIDINNTDRYIRDLTSVSPNICEQRPSEGDKVLILGYPHIGSRENITATRGIISGFEGNYYITDAKIDQGNSGGAAILVKDNCLLGIPTYARLGGIESLGRILDISMFLE